MSACIKPLASHKKAQLMALALEIDAKSKGALGRKLPRGIARATRPELCAVLGPYVTRQRYRRIVKQALGVGAVIAGLAAAGLTTEAYRLRLVRQKAMEQWDNAVATEDVEHIAAFRKRLAALGIPVPTTAKGKPRKFAQNDVQMDVFAVHHNPSKLMNQWNMLQLKKQGVDPETAEYMKLEHVLHDLRPDLEAAGVRSARKDTYYTTVDFNLHKATMRDIMPREPRF